MAKKTEEAPIARRSSYIDVNTGQQTPQPTPTTELPEVGSAELQQIVAETRAAMAADLQARLDEAEAIIRQKQEAIDAISLELAELHEATAELKRAPRGVEAEVYESDEDSDLPKATIVQIDTEAGSGNLRVYLNDGMIYDGDPEQPVTEQVENAEEAPTATFVRILDEHLSTHSSGPTAILNQMERRGPVERAGYLASLERLATMTREKAEQLDDLRLKSEIAGHMLRS